MQAIQTIKKLVRNGYKREEIETDFSIELYDEAIFDLGKEEAWFEDQERQWKFQNVNSYQALIDSGVSEYEARELRRAYLLDELERVARAGGDTSKIKAEYGSRYFTHDRLTDQQIEQAHKTPIAKIIGLTDDFIPCVFHHERSPSLHITDNLFYCFGCQKKGDTISFIRAIKSLKFKEAILFILAF